MHWEYKTTQGETWDVIARRIYGSETLASRIQQANPGYLHLLYFPSGLTLKIPETPDGATVQPPAPWNRSLILDEVPSAVGKIIIEAGYYGGNTVATGGTTDHTELENRGAADQHPTGALTHRDRPLDSVIDSMESTIDELSKSTYDHPQDYPSDVWHIVHNLGVRYPVITVFDADGHQTHGAPDWPNATENTVDVHFANAIAGHARVTV
ncbi:MAG: tail protein X [Planctomycetaceae bacterium]|nr:tail protein X [Planctomycetaceae bacterium]